MRLDHRHEPRYSEADMEEAYRMGCRSGALRALKMARDELGELANQARSAYAEADLPKLLRELAPRQKQDPAVTVTPSPLARRNDLLAESYGAALPDRPIGPPPLVDRAFPVPGATRLDINAAARVGRPWGRPLRPRPDQILPPSAEEHGEKHLPRT